jgi:hypothetical protein
MIPPSTATVIFIKNTYLEVSWHLHLFCHICSTYAWNMHLFSHICSRYEKVLRSWKSSVFRFRWIYKFWALLNMKNWFLEASCLSVCNVCIMDGCALCWHLNSWTDYSYSIFKSLFFVGWCLVNKIIPAPKIGCPTNTYIWLSMYDFIVGVSFALKISSYHPQHQ